MSAILAAVLACACLPAAAAANVVTAPVAPPGGAAAAGATAAGASGSAEVPSIDEEITVPGWWVVGPFLSGVREAGVDPLAFDSEVPPVGNPLLHSGFPSALVPGGMAHWRYYQSGADGVLAVDYPEVPEAAMKLVTDEWGGSGSNTMGLAYATLDLPGPRRALLDLKQAGSVSINGVPWPGDAYGNGMGMQPVLLPAGRVELKVAISAGQRFSLKFLPVPSDLVVFTQSATLPDLVRGDAAPQYIGLPVANNTARWLTVQTATLNSNGLLGQPGPLNVRIPPLCVANLALVLYGGEAVTVPDLANDSFPVFLILNYDGGYIEVKLDLAVRDAGAPRRVTFESHMDKSVQYYGLLPPSNYDYKREYGLILSLHGAGVDAIGQVGSYRPKDWAFVAAPTNRRPFGFDWQDFGQMDMLEVLDQIKRTGDLDENRIHLTGHSMGGHGTWLNALSFPGLWASAAPSAGWTRFDLYAPMFLRQNELLGEPRANYIWQLGMRKDDTLALCENAKNLPIYALEGGADDNVPPQQPRLMVQRLKQLGYDVTYKEVPGMSHWWDDPKTPGLDCVDSDELNAFWKSHVRNPWPKEIDFRSTNPVQNAVSFAGHAQYNGAYWIEYLQPERAGADSNVHAVVNGTTIKVDTLNVAEIHLDLTPELFGAPTGEVVIDGDRFEIDVSPETQAAREKVTCTLPPGYFARVNGHWETFSGIWSSPLSSTASRNIRRKEGLASGPWAQVLMQPCTLVCGTQGSAEEDEWLLQLARLYSWHWWYRANGRLTVTTDVECTNELKQNNVILLGGPELNSVTAELLARASYQPKPRLDIYKGIFPREAAKDEAAREEDVLDAGNEFPVELDPAGVRFGIRRITGPDLSYKFVYGLPQSYGHLMLIEGGTSLRAMKRLPAMMGIYSGSGFPDWMVWDDEVKLKGQAGVLGMGFFDMDWQVDPELSYFNEERISRRMP